MNDTEVYLYTNCKYDERMISALIESTHVLDDIEPGNKVLIKPNFVQETHAHRDEWDYVITHPVVVTAVLKLVLKRLKDRGEIVIADAPMEPTKFEKLIKHFPVDEWTDLCKQQGVVFKLIDLRDRETIIASNGVLLYAKKLAGDPMGEVICNLKGETSEFFSKKTGSAGYYGAGYNIGETNNAHNGMDNQYSVSKTVISADVFINLPKLKAHRKAGMTCCLKNLVGINTNKNLLPHHTSGTPSEGGDQFDSDITSKKIEGKVTVKAKQIVNKVKFLSPALVPLKTLAIRIWGDNSVSVRSGGWWGNDTLWRTILDLNKVLYYANEDGSLRSDAVISRKKYIAIVDGILAGEGNGPLAPDKVEAGYLLAGINPVAIDCIAARIIGFDYLRIPQINKAFECKRYRLADFSYDDIKCSINGQEMVKVKEISDDLCCRFTAAEGWKGHIELNDSNTAR